MLEELDAVDWSALEEAFGAPTEIPDLIRALASTKRKERWEAFVTLEDERIVHQGTRYSTALASVPFLLELLRDSSVPDKDLLLRLLTTVAVGLPNMYAKGTVDEGFPTLEVVRAHDGMLGQIYRAIAEHCDLYAEFLQDKSAKVRTAAAHLLAFFEISRSAAGAALRARLAKERAEMPRTSMILALAAWAALWKETQDRTWFEAALKAEPKPRCQIAAAIGLTNIAGREALDATFDILSLTFTEPLEDDQELLWNGGRLGALAQAALLKIAPPEQVALPVLEATVQGRLNPSLIVSMLFAPSVDGKVRLLPLLSELSELQRQVIIRIGETQNDGYDLWLPEGLALATGLPSMARDLRRYLGLAPPGPMEAPVEGRFDGKVRSWPAIQWFRRVALGILDTETLVEALRAHPDGTTLAGICVEQSLGPYDLFEIPGWDWNAAVFLALKALDGRADAAAELERLVPEQRDSWGMDVALTALTRLWRAQGKAFPAAYDAAVLVMMDHERPPLAQLSTEVLANLPAERRDPILLSLPLPADLQRERLRGRVPEPRHGG